MVSLWRKKVKTYNIGDQVTYNGMDFYVIANSDKTKDSVTLLKAEPLTVDEVNKYGVGHINKYTSANQGTVGNWQINGYGGMTYYSSENCGYVNGSWVTEGCTTDYDASEVKYAVDAWAVDKLNVNDLTKDSLGYTARLLTYEELTINLGYTRDVGATSMSLNTEKTPSWVYNERYYYWTMSQYDNSNSNIWYVYVDGSVNSYYVYASSGYGGFGTVRSVVTLLKSAL